MRLYILVLIVVLAAGCQSSGNSDSTDQSASNENAATDQNTNRSGKSVDIDINEQLDNLTTSNSQISFFRDMIKSDIKTRKAHVSTLQNEGYTSDEYKRSVEEVEILDRNNILRAVGFYERYGVSENQSVGRMQADATWLVVSHNDEVEIHRKLFPAFKTAWDKEYLEGVSFASFLQDFHKLAKGSRLEMKNPYRTIEEIDALLKALKSELK